MGIFKQLQRKSSISSPPATLTRSFLRPSRPFAPLSTSASEQAPPVTQARFDQVVRFGHSLDRTSILPPASRDTKAVLPFPLEEENQLQSRIQAARSNGHPLDKQIQQRLEQGLGAELSGVRIHTDAQADYLSRTVNAMAFTTGSDIFFRSEAYNPGSSQGMHLLTHEATHAVQQAQGPVAGRQLTGSISISDPSDQFEQAAEKAARRIIAVQTVSPTRLGKPVPKRSVPTSSHTLQTVVVQRVPFPPLPAEFETLGDRQHAVFRQYLIALKDTLLNVKYQDEEMRKRIVTDVEQLIVKYEDPAKVITSEDQSLLRFLIDVVNKLKNAPSSREGKLESPTSTLPPSLTSKERIALNDMLQRAQKNIEVALNNVKALESAFGASQETISRAKDNFQKIIKHLTFWSEEPEPRGLFSLWSEKPKPRVQIHRSDVRFAALNHGDRGQSVLQLGKNFFAPQDFESNVGTLIHEASHGSVGTKDHAYREAPYFFMLKNVPPNLALENADHYEYAVALAMGQEKEPGESTEGGSIEEQKLKAACTLAFYKAQKTWEFAMWMHDYYSKTGPGQVEPETRKLHAGLLGLQEHAENPVWTPIFAAQAGVLLNVYNSCKDYFKSESKLTFTSLDNKNFVMKRLNPIKVVLPADISDVSLDEISKAMLKALVQIALGLPERPEWSVIDVGEQLLKHRFERGEKVPGYYIGESDKALLRLLNSAVGTKSLSEPMASISKF